MYGSRTRPRFPESQESFIFLSQFSLKAKSRVKVKGKNTQGEFIANFLQIEISAIIFCYHCTYTSFPPEAKRMIIKILTGYTYEHPPIRMNAGRAGREVWASTSSQVPHFLPPATFALHSKPRVSHDLSRAPLTLQPL